MKEGLDWSGGTLGGTGTVSVLGGISLGGGATNILSRTLNASANTSQDPFNTLRLDGGIWNNLSGARFTSVANEYEQNNITTGSMEGIFNNRAGAVFTKKGIGNLEISATFNNAGLFEILEGNCYFNNSGVNSGIISLSAGTTASFDKGYTHTGTLTGAGSVSIYDSTFETGSSNSLSGPMTIYGKGVFNGPQSIKLLNLQSSFDYQGITGSGSITITDTLEWISGTMAGSGTTNTLSNTTVTIRNANLGRTFNNSGNAIIPADGALVFDANKQGQWNNLAGSTLTLSGNGSIAPTGGVSFDSGLLVNTVGSRILKNGTELSSLYCNFNNQGTVHVNEGTLAIYGKTENYGKMLVAAGSTLYLAAGYYTPFTNLGTIQVNGGLLTDNVSPTFSNFVNLGSGIVDVQSGSASFRNLVGLPITFDVDGSATKIGCDLPGNFVVGPNSTVIFSQLLQTGKNGFNKDVSYCISHIPQGASLTLDGPNSRITGVDGELTMNAGELDIRGGRTLALSDEIINTHPMTFNNSGILRIGNALSGTGGKVIGPHSSLLEGGFVNSSTGEVVLANGTFQGFGPNGIQNFNIIRGNGTLDSSVVMISSQASTPYLGYAAIDNITVTGNLFVTGENGSFIKGSVTVGGLTQITFVGGLNILPNSSLGGTGDKVVSRDAGLRGYGSVSGDVFLIGAKLMGYDQSMPLTLTDNLKIGSHPSEPYLTGNGSIFGPVNVNGLTTVLSGATLTVEAGARFGGPGEILLESGSSLIANGFVNKKVSISGINQISGVLAGQLAISSGDLNTGDGLTVNGLTVGGNSKLSGNGTTINGSTTVGAGQLAIENAGLVLKTA
ncbi:hypothetical protein KIH39_11195 [Telmatocola sphagniphila]|uniref:Uncharacterized protein n=1 Tax=Telmatocola sphagniphila TaxID=1123043 RepID=A0A8E6BAN4_9BACT|nr:hypothetical protein [Telmatocola sphagniphila]QVL34442.1 hypothetical protein KIH39_11195 [Telmatocola sphagniphila]